MVLFLHMAEKNDKEGKFAEDAGPGLDMKHGFVQHIRKNQINRDDYDKEVRIAKKNQRPRRQTPAPTRPRKPDMNRYMPPSNGPVVQGSGHGDHSGTASVDDIVLFKLEYEDDDGDVSKLLVLKDDDPHEVAAEFGQACGIDQTLIEALAFRIHQEMKKRGT